MSDAVLCEAVVEQIKSVLIARNTGWIDVRPTGEPPSSLANDVFVAIHSEGSDFTGLVGGGDYSRNSGKGLDNGLAEQYHIHATVSVKTSRNHTAFWGSEIAMTWEGSLNYAVRSIVNAIHGQPDVIVMANRRLQTVVTAPFVELLKCLRIEPKKERGSKWWGTTSTASSARTNDIIGYSQTVHFFGALRVQNIGQFT